MKLLYISTRGHYILSIRYTMHYIADKRISVDIYNHGRKKLLKIMIDDRDKKLKLRTIKHEPSLRQVVANLKTVGGRSRSRCSIGSGSITAFARFSEVYRIPRSPAIARENELRVREFALRTHARGLTVR